MRLYFNILKNCTFFFYMEKKKKKVKPNMQKKKITKSTRAMFALSRESPHTCSNQQYLNQLAKEIETFFFLA